MQEPAQTNFLDLPRELRDRVYDFLIVDSKCLQRKEQDPKFSLHAFIQDAPSAAALLRTSSQMHAEYSDRLPRKEKVTIHGSVRHLLGAFTLVPKHLHDAIVECFVYFPVYLGLGSLARNITWLTNQSESLIERIPSLQILHLKFASRNLVGYSQSERISHPSWTLEQALDRMTTGRCVQSVQDLEGNNYVVPCGRCRDLYRALHADTGSGQHCNCRICMSYHQSWYIESNFDGSLGSEQRTCSDCGKHNFYQWGFWSKGDGWKYFERSKQLQSLPG